MQRRLSKNYSFSVSSSNEDAGSRIEIRDLQELDDITPKSSPVKKNTHDKNKLEPVKKKSKTNPKAMLRKNSSKIS